MNNPFMCILVFGFGIFAACGLATYWIIKEEEAFMKKYDVYAEYMVTKKIGTINAESEEEAILLAAEKIKEKNAELGTDPEIVWSEEAE